MAVMPVSYRREGTAMPTIALSESALALFRLHLEQDGIRVDDANREAHRELAAAGILYPVSTFRRGPERISASPILDGNGGMKF
jgi:hypothetical protein